MAATTGAVPAVFLVGAPRSGTSLLYKCLCLHPEAAWLSNWVRRFPGLPGLGAGNRLAAALPDRRRRTWFAAGGNAYVYGTARNLGERIFPMPVEGEPFFARFGLPGPGGVPNGTSRPGPLAAATRAVVRAAGGSVFVSKRIAHNWRIPLLAEAFPAARFVEIVRDGRAVAYSLSQVDWWDECELGWTEGTPRTWREAGGDPWELCARHWIEELGAVGRGLETVPAPQKLRIAYEEFVADPVPTLEKVAAFAGLGSDPAWRDEVAALSYPSRNDTWRARLDPGAVRRIEAVEARHLEANGYAIG